MSHVAQEEENPCIFTSDLLLATFTILANINFLKWDDWLQKGAQFLDFYLFIIFFHLRVLFICFRFMPGFLYKSSR